MECGHCYDMTKRIVESHVNPEPQVDYIASQYYVAVYKWRHRLKIDRIKAQYSYRE